MQDQPAPGQTVEPHQAEPARPAAPAATWQFTADDSTPDHAPQASPKPDDGKDSISWTASEFIAHHKTGGWYVLLALVTLGIMSVIYFFTRDFISTGMIALVLIALGVFAARQPRTLPYHLDNQGLQIGPKSYPYGVFRSFSVIDEGLVHSITLAPLGRFMTPISIYYEPKDEAAIVDIISLHLPFEESSLDYIERIMRRIHF